MKTMMMSILVKILDVDALCQLIAKAIAAILAYASKNGGRSWDIAKAAISKANVWTSLFLQVYEDDTLSAEDEKLIAEAIKSQTSIEKLAGILKKTNNEERCNEEAA